ncbi:MAG: hypothetical protein E7172_00550 [Firmicutes bacterium]|nr:hypothetical protein [Bacillota bacterium]
MKIINYNLKTNKNINNLKIILISDLHYKEKYDLNIFKNIIKNLKKLKPNYICITGDIIHNSKLKDFDSLKTFLENLSLIAPIIMVFGNHDFSNSKKYYFNNKYYQLLKKIPNLYLLNNENITFNNITFIGLNLPIDYYEKNNESLDSFKSFFNNLNLKLFINKNNYQIILIHSTLAFIDVYKNEDLANLENVDLVLSGHTHGGVVPFFLEKLFGKRGLVAPNFLKSKKIFINNVRGLIKVKNLLFIISTGILKLHIPARKLFFKEEINVINIKSVK